MRGTAFDGSIFADSLELTGINGTIKAIAPWIPREAMAAIPVGWLNISGMFLKMDT
jgi:hypothetical protein